MYIIGKLFQLKQFYFRFVSQVALVVGEFESVEARSEEGILVRVFTPIGKKEQVSFSGFPVFPVSFFPANIISFTPIGKKEQVSFSG